MPDLGQADPSPQNVFDNRDAYWWEGGKKVESGAEFAPRKLHRLEELLSDRMRRLTAYQDRAYAERYRQLLIRPVCT